MISAKKILGFCSVIGIYLTLFYSIFAVYYTSPLVRGSVPIPLNTTPFATHLVFMITDGMRADKLFGSKMENAPFIKDLLLNHGVWGLSHTRVPTESRPGHIAMLGGFYEDVASVTKGWQANVVEFDSLLNRSQRAWAWGTREVVEAFGLGASNHVQVMSSPGELSDLAKHNLTDIDRWTVDQFVRCLHDNTTGFFAPHHVTEVDTETFRRGHIAFLHMDAADLVGHAFKPNSDEYTQMVRNVDSLVSEVVHEVTRLSSGLDVKVAFILSADHGMTEWGSHGAGSLHETVTPLVAWGAGLVGPELLPSSDDLVGFDQYGLPLHNHGRRRRELQQADLCPLMASLLGIPIPVNSVGRVPLDFLDVNSSVKAQLVRANCMQLISQLQLKLLEKRGSHFRAFFREFDKLTESDIEERLRSAELLTSNGLHDQAIESYEQLANLTLTALAYYHKYDRPFFGLCIGASFLLWSLVIWCNLASPADTKYVSNQYRHRFDQCFQLTAFVLLAFILLVLGFSYLWPISHTAFQLLPLVLSLYLVRSSSYKARLYNTLVSLFRKTKETDHMANYHILGSNRSGNSPITFASLISVASLLLLELLIWGFHYRPLLFVACVILAIWPALDRSFGSDRKHLHRFWFLACCILAVFPLLPVIGSSFSPGLVFASGMAITPISLLIYRKLSRSSVEYTKHSFLLSSPRMLGMGYLFSFLFASSSCAVGLVHSHLGFLPSIRFPIHVFSWSMLLLPSLFVLKWLSPRLGLRLFGWISVFLIPLILLSTGYEVLFFIAFMTVGLLWIQLEAPGRDWTQVWFQDTSASHDVREAQLTCLSGDANDLVTLKNFRQSLFFLFLLVISFFGTGNIASVNSFDPRSTYCFLTILKPSVMGLFLLIKVLSPMICLAIIYAAVQLVSAHRGSVNTQTGLCTIMSNFVAVHFFACLRDEGSWLEIGNSISHYVIAMAVGLVSFLFALLGRQLLSVSLPFSAAATKKHM